MELLQFPQADARPKMDGFEAFDGLSEVLASILYLGYKGDLPRISVFNKKYLAHIYNTLFTILNRCLMGKNSGFDSITHLMALLFQGVVENRHYDFAQLIFSDLVEMVNITKKKKSMKYLLYVRLFSKVIHSAMIRNPEIPRRLNHQRYELYNMHSVRYSTKEFNFERPLIATLLDYADQQAPSMVEYRCSHALTVQPEPEEPTYSAHHSGEDIGSRDSRPGVQSQGALRENENERGSGMKRASVDQPKHSSIQDVVAHIGQISSEVPWILFLRLQNCMKLNNQVHQHHQFLQSFRWHNRK